MRGFIVNVNSAVDHVEEYVTGITANAENAKDQAIEANDTINKSKDVFDNLLNIMKNNTNKFGISNQN